MFILRCTSTLIVIGDIFIVGPIAMLSTAGKHLLVSIIQYRSSILCQSLIPRYIALVTIQVIAERTRRNISVIHHLELAHDGLLHVCGGGIEAILCCCICAHSLPGTATQHKTILLDNQRGISIAVPTFDRTGYQTALHDIGTLVGIGASHQSTQTLRAVCLYNLTGHQTVGKLTVGHQG